MKNISITLVFLLTVFNAFSQELCTSEEKNIIDVNLVSKCTTGAKEVKKEKEFTTTVISKRYLKKRVVLAAKVATLSDLKTKAIKVIESKNNLAKKELIEVKSRVAAVSKTIAPESSVSFNSIEEIPLFASCKDTFLKKEECFNYEMEQHIIANFKYPEEALNNKIEGNMNVTFIIDVDGNVKDINVIGSEEGKILKKEAKRIVSLLPRFIPGKQNGIKTAVFYSFPMSFTLD